MVHIKNAAIAGGTVMTALWLENMTDEAVPAPFVVRIVEIETLKNMYGGRKCLITQYNGTRPGSVSIVRMKHMIQSTKIVVKMITKAYSPAVSARREN
mgnify:FL=1